MKKQGPKAKGLNTLHEQKTYNKEEQLGYNEKHILKLWAKSASNTLVPHLTYPNFF